MESDQEGTQMKSLVSIEPSTTTARYRCPNDNNDPSTGAARFENPDSKGDSIAIDISFDPNLTLAMNWTSYFI